MSEKIISEYVYSMRTSQPLFFAILIITSPLGVGLVLLITWRLFMLPRPRLIITDRSVKYVNCVKQTETLFFADIGGIDTGSGLFQWVVGSGWIKIRKKPLFSIPIFFNGIRNPELVKQELLTQMGY